MSKVKFSVKSLSMLRFYFGPASKNQNIVSGMVDWVVFSKGEHFQSIYQTILVSLAVHLYCVRISLNFTYFRN